MDFKYEINKDKKAVKMYANNEWTVIDLDLLYHLLTCGKNDNLVSYNYNLYDALRDNYDIKLDLSNFDSECFISDFDNIFNTNELDLIKNDEEFKSYLKKIDDDINK